MRPVPLPPRKPNWAILLLIALAFALSIIWISSQVASCERRASAQDPAPIANLTRAQRLARIIEDCRILGSQIALENPDHRITVLRQITGQNVAAWAFVCNDVPEFDANSGKACDALWDQWYWIAEAYQTCDR